MTFLNVKQNYDVYAYCLLIVNKEVTLACETIHFRMYMLGCVRICSKYEWSNQQIVKPNKCDGDLILGKGGGGGGH